jgi:D-sedoheptulose 7-phosphate isomerase
MNNHLNLIQECFDNSAKNLASLAQAKKVQEELDRSIEMILASLKAGGTLFVCGNGGSAADAQHMVAELVAKLDKDRTPIRAVALTVDTSILTAVGNDYGYEWAFARQVDALMKPSDVLLAITTSGNSPNVLKALDACKSAGAKSILLSGREGGKAKALADHSILATGNHTGLIQEAHIVIYHTLCLALEKALVQAGLCKYR